MHEPVSGVTPPRTEPVLHTAPAASDRDGYLRGIIHRAIAEASAEGLDEDAQNRRAAEKLLAVFRPYLDMDTLFQLVRLLRD